MALIRIRIASSGRVIWAKLSQAAKLVTANHAEYVDGDAEQSLTRSASPYRSGHKEVRKN